jgi:hypothetical protein
VALLIRKKTNFIIFCSKIWLIWENIREKREKVCDCVHRSNHKMREEEDKSYNTFRIGNFLTFLGISKIVLTHALKITRAHSHLTCTFSLSLSKHFTIRLLARGSCIFALMVPISWTSTRVDLCLFVSVLCVDDRVLDALALYFESHQDHNGIP